MITILILLLVACFLIKGWHVAPDGGRNSGVRFYGVEFKRGVSIGVLQFIEAPRENYHEHAFNAWALWLSGSVTELRLRAGVHDEMLIDAQGFSGGQLKFTPRSNCHRILVNRPAWALTLRGPWRNRWREYHFGHGWVTLTHGRQVVSLAGWAA